MEVGAIEFIYLFLIFNLHHCKTYCYHVIIKFDCIGTQGLIFSLYNLKSNFKDDLGLKKSI